MAMEEEATAAKRAPGAERPGKVDTFHHHLHPAACPHSRLPPIKAERASRSNLHNA